MSIKSSNTVWHPTVITRQDRENLNGHQSLILWFTGLSGSGKSTMMHAVEELLHQKGMRTFTLDGDNVRHGLCADLGFSEKDRQENIRRIGEVTKLCTEAGLIVLAAFISPFIRDRQRVRNLASPGDFLEIYCRCSLDVCETRDTKGLYRRARAGEIKDFTGISSPYEEPVQPELILETGVASIAQCAQQVVDMVMQRALLYQSESFDK
ncbi:MAG: adenylyl-sulfate kinase [Magnetococcus sp. DMHC-6]